MKLILPNSQRSSACFGYVKRGCNWPCFCPKWSESAQGNSDYTLLCQDVKLVWKSFENINPRTFLSYLCVSVTLFPTENYLYHSEFPSTEHDFEIPWFLEIFQLGKRDEINQWSAAKFLSLRFEKQACLSVLVSLETFFFLLPLPVVISCTKIFFS